MSERAPPPRRACDAPARPPPFHATPQGARKRAAPPRRLADQKDHAPRAGPRDRARGPERWLRRARYPWPESPIEPSRRRREEVRPRAQLSGGRPGACPRGRWPRPAPRPPTLRNADELLLSFPPSL